MWPRSVRFFWPLSNGRNPEAQLSPALIFEHTAICLDDFARSDVGAVARHQSAIDPKPSRNWQRVVQHLCCVAAPAHGRSDVVADVATRFEQSRCQTMANIEPADPNRARDEPEQRVRHPAAG